jgi:hypothetical protein
MCISITLLILDLEHEVLLINLQFSLAGAFLATGTQVVFVPSFLVNCDQFYLFLSNLNNYQYIGYPTFGCREYYP